MAIVKMKKLKLFISRADKESVISDLTLLGCLEVSEPDEILKDQELTTMVTRESSEIDRSKADLSVLTRGIDVINHFAPVKTGLFSQKPEVTGDLLLDDSDTQTCLELAKTLDSLDNKIRKLAIDDNNEHNLIESLKPWKSLEFPLNTENTSKCDIILGTIASSYDISAIQSDLAASIPESELILISSDNEQHYLLLICLKANRLEINDYLRNCNFAPTGLKNINNTAADGIIASEIRLDANAQERTEITDQIKAAADYRDTLQLCYDHISTKIAQAEASANFLGTQYALMLTGWVPASSDSELLKILNKYDCAWEMTDPLESEFNTVPVLLKNNPLTRPLSMVTEMYSLPAYGSVDPNPPMMPFFVLFYGLMMADMGYGLIMTIAAIIVKRKKPQGGMRNFFDLLLLCGISTFVIGAITGGLFGDAPSQIAGLFGATFTLPYKPLFSALDNTSEVLIGALALGMIHILFGMGISFVRQVKNGHILDAIFDIGSWWIIFAGIALGALGITWWVAIVGLAMIVIMGGRDKKNIFARLIGGVGKLYDITGYFGDILSYSRVMALMLAGGVIAQVFNTLGALTGNIFTFTVIFLIGHALNFGLNLLGCFVHDMRLQCLEFFGKFYEDGGRPFHPLNVRIKYNNIVNK